MKAHLSFHFFSTLIAAAICQTAMGLAEEIVVWHTESDPDTQKAFDIVGKEVQLRTGATVRNEYVQWSSLSRRLKLAMNSKDPSRLPDIAHLEPYMAYSLHALDALDDISDIVEELKAKKEGPINTNVIELQHFNGKYYGIAQHLGVSFILFRNDLLQSNNQTAPQDWDAFFDVCRALSSMQGNTFHPILLPGSSPFFMECIFSELLNSRGTSVYGHNGEPELTSSAVKQCLDIFARMKPFVAPEFERTDYQQQFTKLVKGDGAFVMFAGARAYKAFENSEKTTPLASLTNKYRCLPPPTFKTEGNKKGSFTSLDCEPFVVFKLKVHDRQKIKEWYKVFYTKGFYLPFCRTTPIQLIPIFDGLRGEYEKSPDIMRWSGLMNQAQTLIGQGRVRPYFMQESSPTDLDYLFEVHDSQIFYELIVDVIRSGRVEDGRVRQAQDELSKLIDRTSQRYSSRGRVR